MAASTPSTDLAKALAHPLRVNILKILDSGLPASPNMLSKELGEPLGNVSYHMKTLLAYGCVDLVKTEPRRGAVEHFYRATGIVVVGAIQISRLEAQMAAEAIKATLLETEGTENEDTVDAAGRAEGERDDLRRLANRLARESKSAT